MSIRSYESNFFLLSGENVYKWENIFCQKPTNCITVVEACKFSLIMEGILQLMNAPHTPDKTRKKEVDNWNPNIDFVIMLAERWRIEIKSNVCISAKTNEKGLETNSRCMV